MAIFDFFKNIGQVVKKKVEDFLPDLPDLSSVKTSTESAKAPGVKETPKIEPSLAKNLQQRGFTDISGEAYLPPIEEIRKQPAVEKTSRTNAIIENQKQIQPLKEFNATHYDPYDVAQTRPGSEGVGAFGKKVEFGDVAMGNRNYPEGTLIYVPELKDVNTPHGQGIFRVNDKKNIRYNTGIDSFDIAIPTGTPNAEQLKKRIGNNRFNFQQINTSAITSPPDVIKKQIQYGQEEKSIPKTPFQKFISNFGLDAFVDQQRSSLEDRRLAKDITDNLIKNKQIKPEEANRLKLGLNIGRPLNDQEQFIFEQGKKQQEDISNMAFAATMPIEDLGAQAMNSLEKFLGRKATQIEKEALKNNLIEMGKNGAKLVDITPEGEAIFELKNLKKESSPATDLLKDVATEKPVIKNSAIEVGGNLYEAPSHGEAMQKAKNAGEDISQINRWNDGLFRTSDNRIITRDQARTEFGIDQSENIPTQFGQLPREHYPTPEQTPKMPLDAPSISEQAIIPTTPQTPSETSILPEKAPSTGSIGLLKRIGKQIAPQDYISAEKYRQEKIRDYLGQEAPHLQIQAEEQSRRLENLNSNVVQGIKNNPYFKKEKAIKDIMGEGWLMRDNKGKTVVATPNEVEQFTFQGYKKVIEIDSLAKEAGFDRGYDYLQDQLDISKIKPQFNFRKIAEQQLKKTDKIFLQASKKVEQVRGELQGKQVKAESLFRRMGQLNTQTKRREQVKAITDYFGLSTADAKKVSAADIGTMTDVEFRNYIKGLEGRAYTLSLKNAAREDLITTIQTKDLQKINGFRKFLKLPTIQKMTIGQLKQFDEILSKFETGDIFLSKKMIENIDKTELFGVRTTREVIEKVSKIANIDPDKLSQIVPNWKDYYLFSTPLAQKNEFYKFMVDKYNAVNLEATKNILDTRREINKLAKNARGKYQFVPQDTKVFEWLNADPTKKQELAKDMNDAELKFATFVRDKFIEMRDELIKRGTLNTYLENYVTYIQKDILETIKDDGIIKAIKNAFKSQQEAEADFKALQSLGNTEDGISFEKFFKFSQKRTGEVVPTKNVARAFMAYYSSFQRKLAIDEIVPEIKSLVYAIHPEKRPERIEMEKFVNAWLNNKKGLRKEMFVKRNTGLDIALKGLNSAISLIDMGFSLPIGIGSNVGENMLNLVELGSKQFALAQKRKLTPEGKALLKKYSYFTGVSVWEDIRDVSKDVGDQLMEAAFGFFHDAQVRGNKTYLLGKVTEEELKSGKISDERLAQLQRELGNYRIIEGEHSIYGATPESKLLMKYKTWAVPALFRTADNLKYISQKIQRDGAKEALKDKRFQELLRSTVLTGLVGLLVTTYFAADPNDSGIVAKLKNKIASESLSSLAILDPSFWTNIRAAKFLQDLSTGIIQTAKLEEYKTSNKYVEAGQLKGPRKLQQTLTPGFLKQFLPQKEVSTGKDKSGMPDLPELPDLPGLPSLPNL